MENNNSIFQIKDPVKINFPDLSSFFTIKDKHDTLLLGAGPLADGLVCPIYLDEESAKKIIEEYMPNETGYNIFQIKTPFTLMIEAAKQGAAGFMVSLELNLNKNNEDIFKLTQGRLLFPFLVRFEETSSTLPKVLGSGLKCDNGTYLTRFGERKFDNFELIQWVNHKLMDRASGSMAILSPFRTYEEGASFWCLSDEPSEIGIFSELENDRVGIYNFDEPSIVYFAEDNALKQYCAMEGYFPIFTSHEAAKHFLEHRLGGAFHIVSLDTSIKNYIRHKGLFSYDLKKPQKGLSASIKEIKNLPLHLKKLTEKFKLTPWSCFIINPKGHREDLAHGIFHQTTKEKCVIKGVSGEWEINDEHKFKKIKDINYFDGRDTFHFNIFNFQFSELEKSNCKKIETLDGIDIKDFSELELDELIDSKIKEDHKEFSIPEDIEDLIFSLQEGEKHFKDYNKSEKNKILDYYQNLSQKWCLKYWETVSGETSEIIYFDNFFSLAKYIIELDKHDMPQRVYGSHDESSYGHIGFEGSKDEEKEKNHSERFYKIVKKICKNVLLFGFNQNYAFDLALASNNFFRSKQLSICIFIHDGLITFLPDNGNSEEDFYNEIGFPKSIISDLFSKLEQKIHPESLSLLEGKIGDKKTKYFTQDSLLFLSTALYNFEKLGKNKNFDYAPVSVQIVKSLEFEIRTLFKKILNSFQIDRSYNFDEDEKRIIDFAKGQDEIVNLGFLTNALRKSKNYSSGPFKEINRVISISNHSDLLSKQNIKLILKDVLNRFRNGGSHDKLISLETCEECISKLLNNKEDIGLITKFAKLNSEISDQKKERISE